MAKSFTLAGLALAATGLALSAPAAAAPAAHSAAASASAALTSSYTTPSVFHQQTVQFDRDRRDWRGRSDRRDRRYQSRGNYDRYAADYGQPLRQNTRVWRGNDGRAYCQKDDGTTGLLIGAGVGALIGSEVASRNDRTLGVILGAAGGALLGREIDRRGARCR